MTAMEEKSPFIDTIATIITTAQKDFGISTPANNFSIIIGKNATHYVLSFFFPYCKNEQELIHALQKDTVSQTTKQKRLSDTQQDILEKFVCTIYSLIKIDYIKQKEYTIEENQYTLTYKILDDATTTAKGRIYVHEASLTEKNNPKPLPYYPSPQSSPSASPYTTLRTKKAIIPPTPNNSPLSPSFTTNKKTIEQRLQELHFSPRLQRNKKK